MSIPASDCQAATDPIQQLFADKVKEYAKKKAAAGGKLPDASKETEAAIAMELEKVGFKKNNPRKFRGLGHCHSSK